MGNKLIHYTNDRDNCERMRRTDSTKLDDRRTQTFFVAEIKRRSVRVVTEVHDHTIHKIAPKSSRRSPPRHRSVRVESLEKRRLLSTAPIFPSLPNEPTEVLVSTQNLDSTQNVDLSQVPDITFAQHISNESSIASATDAAFTAMEFAQTDLSVPNLLAIADSTLESTQTPGENSSFNEDLFQNEEFLQNLGSLQISESIPIAEFPQIAEASSRTEPTVATIPATFEVSTLATGYAAEDGGNQENYGDLESSESLANSEITISSIGSWSTTNQSQLRNLSNEGSGVHASDAQAMGVVQETVVVAVIDTGYDPTSEILAGNIWTNSKEIAGNGIDDDSNGFIDDVSGYDFVSNDASPFDENRHGTFVSGILVQVDPNVQIVPIRTLDASGKGSVEDAIAGIRYAVQLRESGVNLRVINCSWILASIYNEELHQAIREAANAGILVVLAAGNNAKNIDTAPMYPACDTSSNVITVAAVDSNGNLSGFSNYGEESVDLGAPGGNIFSYGLDGIQLLMSGSSFSAAHVSAIATMIWSRLPNATVQEVRDAILNSVTKTDALTGKVASGGFVNAVSALLSMGIRTYNTPVVAQLSCAETDVRVGETVTMIASGITVDGGGDATLRLYTDTNKNGVLDSADTLLMETVVTGSATRANVRYNTVGSCTVFAEIVNSVGAASDPVATSVRVQRTSLETSTSFPELCENRAIGGTLTRGGEVVYQLSVTEGQTYTIRTSLGTLSDTFLTLANSDGVVLLKNDDENASCCASVVRWKATYTGSVQVKITSPDRIQKGTFWVTMSVVE